MPHAVNVQFRTLRLATGLLQEDIARLLGFKGAAPVSRLEHAARTPDLRTAFACEHILGAPASSIFSSLLHEEIERIAPRARRRLMALSHVANDPRHALRLRSLAALVAPQPTLFDL